MDKDNDDLDTNLSPVDPPYRTATYEDLTPGSPDHWRLASIVCFIGLQGYTLEEIGQIARETVDLCVADAPQPGEHRLRLADQICRELDCEPIVTMTPDLRVWAVEDSALTRNLVWALRQLLSAVRYCYTPFTNLDSRRWP